MIEHTKENLIALKALYKLSNMKIDATLKQMYETAAQYREAEKKIMFDLGLNYDYLKDRLVIDIELMEKKFRRNNSLNNLLDEL